MIRPEYPLVCSSLLNISVPLNGCSSRYSFATNSLNIRDRDNRPGTFKNPHTIPHISFKLERINTHINIDAG